VKLNASILEKTIKILIGLLVITISIWAIRTIVKTKEGSYGLYGIILALTAGIFLILNQFFKF
ncbi:MAG: hypothetical protein PHY93_20480, partial [Bacteriovorax sp.]|nr:hypothetical protein [Bacteriovorax sp.]